MGKTYADNRNISEIKDTNGNIKNDGLSVDNILGTYIHGIFDSSDVAKNIILNPLPKLRTASPTAAVVLPLFSPQYICISPLSFAINITGYFSFLNGAEFSGYEIHMGKTYADNRNISEIKDTCKHLVAATYSYYTFASFCILHYFCNKP